MLIVDDSKDAIRAYLVTLNLQRRKLRPVPAIQVQRRPWWAPNAFYGFSVFLSCPLFENRQKVKKWFDFEPGADVMIFKILSPNFLTNKLAFFCSNYY
jgi:hypothetical protein